MATESYVQVPLDSTGKKIDTATVTLDDTTQQYRQTVAIGDGSTGNAVASVTRDGQLLVKNLEEFDLLSQILIELRVLNYQIQSTQNGRDDLDQLRNSGV